MIFFKTVRYKNFLSTGNLFTEIYLNKHQMTLIVGENGAGKSTMLDALTFALFGKSFRNINKPQLVNSINGKECVVEVEFSISAKNYKIIRGLKPNKFEIYCNDVMINQDASARDYQDYLEKNILRFNLKAFTQIVILGSSSFVPFMQLTAGDRRAIIEDLLDIQIFSSMNSVVKDKISALKNEASEIKRNIDTTKSQIELQQKYVEEAKKNNKEQVEAKEKELVKLQEEVASWEEKLELVVKHRDVMSKKLNDNLDSLQSKKKAFDSYEIKIESNLNKINKNIKFFEENSTCPTCDQSIKNKQKKIKEFNEERSKYDDGLTALRDQRKSVEDKLKNALTTQRKINEHNAEIKSMEATIKQLKKYESKVQTEIFDLKQKKEISDDMLDISKKLVEKMEELENQRKEFANKKQYIEVASLLLKDSGIKAKIIKQYLPIINKLVNKYLSSMNFFVNFEIDEEFKETIKSRHRDDFSYQNFSEGERMRIDLALLLTWRSVSKIKNSMNTNILVLDEVFDSSLDSSGTEEFMKLLHTLGSDVNIYVISHKGDVLVDKFHHILKFEKVKNFSQLSV